MIFQFKIVVCLCFCLFQIKSYKKNKKAKGMNEEIQNMAVYSQTNVIKVFGKKEKRYIPRGGRGGKKKEFISGLSKKRKVQRCPDTNTTISVCRCVECKAERSSY